LGYCRDPGSNGVGAINNVGCVQIFAGHRVPADAEDNAACDHFGNGSRSWPLRESEVDARAVDDDLNPDITDDGCAD
jgi:hypothetical protein